LKSKQSVCILCFWGAHYLLLPDGKGECVTHCYQLSLYILCLYRLVLRHHATSRKVAGSWPDEMNDFFQFT
jgi:hypothetical protein